MLDICNASKIEYDIESEARRIHSVAKYWWVEVKRRVLSLDQNEKKEGASLMPFGRKVLNSWSGRSEATRSQYYWDAIQQEGVWKKIEVIVLECKRGGEMTDK